MSALSRKILGLGDCQPWDDHDAMRDQMVIEADAYEEAQIVARRDSFLVRDKLRFAIGNWHRLAGLATKAEAQGSSDAVKRIIYRAIDVCESQIESLGGEVPTL